jgi:hypothetical protein
MLAEWKVMVYEAIRAAPWHHDGPSTSEFVADGGNVPACIETITDYATDEDGTELVKVVYQRSPTTPLGSDEAAAAYKRWLRSP